MLEVKDFTTILSLTAAMTAILFILTTYVSRFKDRKYDEEKRRIELDMMRASLEARIYRETDKLTSTSNRWSDVNHLILDSINKLDKKIEINSNQILTGNRFLESLGVNEVNKKVKNKKVFVLTPFHSRYEETYDLISKTCNKVGLNCSRGDEEFIRGGVLSHIIKEIAEASIIIANIDGRNPNVFYEMGIAHALDKDVIIVSSSVNGVPFDLSSQRLIIWKGSQELSDQLTSTLTKVLLERD